MCRLKKNPSQHSGPIATGLVFTYKVEVLHHHHLMQRRVRLVLQHTPQALREPRVDCLATGVGGSQEGWGDGRRLMEQGRLQTEAKVHRLKHPLLVGEEPGH